MTPVDNPLPANSSIYVHKNCINKTKMAMKNVTSKGPMNDFIKYKSNCLTLKNFFIKKNKCIL